MRCYQCLLLPPRARVPFPPPQSARPSSISTACRDNAYKMWRKIIQGGAKSVEDIPNLPKALYKLAKEDFTLTTSEVVSFFIEYYYTVCHPHPLSPPSCPTLHRLFYHAHQIEHASSSESVRWLALRLFFILPLGLLLTRLPAYIFQI